MFIIMCGLPGSGKSTVAKLIVEQTSGMLLRSDVVRRELFATRSYSSDETAAVYRELLLRAIKYAQCIPVVVLDASFAEQKFRAQAMNQATAAGLGWALIWVTSPIAKVRIRLAQRTDDPSEADFAVYKKLRTQFDPVDVSQFKGHIIHIENDSDLAELQQKVKCLPFVNSANTDP